MTENRRGEMVGGWYRLQGLILRLRHRRWANLVVVNTRILIGFAFVPAGLKKVLGQPFTDPQNVGVFHEFLHAFAATGPFYRFVGGLQLLGAVLLMTQTFATVGAVIVFPMIAAITVLCWSTAGVPTIVTVTAMLLGTLGLLMWDVHRWRGIFLGDTERAEMHIEPIGPVIEARLWQWCGIAILGVYLLSCLLYGGVYRPRGVALRTPAFYVLPLIAFLPVVTWLVDRARYRKTAAENE